MKKFILGAFMLTTVLAASAQDTKVVTTTTNYGYAVPGPIITNFRVNYPTVTQVTWMPVDDWWYATYTTEGDRIQRVYYNTQPYYLDKDESFTVALPVMNTFIPDEIVRDAVSKHGSHIFSITAGKMMDSGQRYYVTVIKDGKSEIIPLN